MNSQHTPSDLNVSRETFERLEVLAELLEKWNRRINLVSKQSIPHLWERHIKDSVQILACADIQSNSHWVDIGSGGGFPGLVIAAALPELAEGAKITMIESDIRKCSFLRSALREMGVTGHVICQRIESTEPQNADILSARALSDLTNLLGFADHHLSKDGQALFPKGVNWKKEVLEAEESWSFTHEAIKSKTQEGAVILKIGDITHV